METIEQIFFRKINPSDFRNMYSVAVPSSGGGQTYIEAAGVADDALIDFLDYAEIIAPTSKQETRMAYRFNCYKVDDAKQYDFVEFQPRRGRNYRIVRQTEAHRHPAWSVDNGFPAPLKDSGGTYLDDAQFGGIIDNLIIVIIRTSYRKYYAWFVNESTIPANWPKDVGLESMFVGDRRGILVFKDTTLGFISNTHCPFGPVGKGKGVLVTTELTCDSRQLITYGAPGTGKSFMVDGLTDNSAVAACVRTTFHPDSDYATFVGAYKPTMNAGKIEYSFRPQAFMNAYVKAWKLMANPSEDGKTENVVLVIEEINRGNCAQIFGDLFQLLDRDGQSGYSTYPIDADVDLAVWLGGRFGYVEDDENKNGLNVASRPSCLTQSDWNDVLKGKKLVLPPNLYIWATMNTSDQSLFPIDSAFKRRWDWKYVPISKPSVTDWKDRKIDANGKLYDWWDFIRIINAHIAKVTKSEDKQLGYFFVKAPDDTGVITAERFANKVLFYLFNDVFKDWDLPVAIFEKDSNSKKKFAFKDFFYDVPDANHAVGSVREDVVAAFIEKQEYEGEKVKSNTPATPGEEPPATPAPEVAPPPAQS